MLIKLKKESYICVYIYTHTIDVGNMVHKKYCVHINKYIYICIYICNNGPNLGTLILGVNFLYKLILLHIDAFVGNTIYKQSFTLRL